MLNLKTKNQAGVSYVELLVVITILVIISTIALMNIGSAKTQLGRQNVARELKSAFERARFDSVKRRALGSDRANVVITANSFTLNTDINQNGTIATDEARINNAWMADVSIKKQDGTELDSTVTVTFDKRGEVSTSEGSAVFLICNGNCSTPNAANSNLVLVTQTGTVNILPGGNTVPTFATPSVSNIGNSADIKQDVGILN